MRIPQKGHLTDTTVSSNMRNGSEVGILADDHHNLENDNLLRVTLYIGRIRLHIGLRLLIISSFLDCTRTAVCNLDLQIEDNQKNQIFAIVSTVVYRII